MARSITIRGFDTIAERMAASTLRRTSKIVTRGMGVILSRAREQWPVSSGDSAAAFSLKVASSGDIVSVEVRNTSGYAQFINRGDTWDDLIRRPWLLFLHRLPAMIEDGDDNG